MRAATTHDEADDTEIVRGLRRAEAAAFDAAYARYRARLFSFLARMTGRRSVAEELLQETWLRLAEHATDLAEDTSLRAWLFTVARNLAASHLRWRLLDALRLPLGGRFVATPASPFDLASAAESERRVEAAVAALPPAQREALLLVAGERLEPAEAARIAGVSPETLRQRLSRARAAVAAALDERGPP